MDYFLLTPHFRQKINKASVILYAVIDQLDLIDIYKTFHPKTAEYKSFPSAHGTFSRTDHMLGHKISLNKFKRIEIISSILYYNNSMERTFKMVEE